MKLTSTRNATRNPWLWAAAGVGTCLLARRLLRGRYSFRDKVVLITGGSRGLGLVMARQLAAEGAKVAICARSSPELERAASELRGQGAEVLALPCDIAQAGEVQAMVEDLTARWPAVDVLINNAGVIQVGPMEEMTLEDYEQAMRTHFWGPLYTTLALLPQMRRRGQGRIVNVSSIGGKISVPHLLPYSASKFALVGFRKDCGQRSPRTVSSSRPSAPG